MGLEAATYVGDLVAANPTATDVRSQGDDHLRLLKAVLLATFPNASRAQYLAFIQPEQTADFTVVAPDDSEKSFPCNANSAALTVTLPASGLYDGMGLRVFKSDFGPNIVTVDGNGKLVNGVSTQKLIKGYQSCYLTYSTELGAWLAQKDTVIPTGTFLDCDASSVDGYQLCDGTSTIGDASSGATVAAVYTSALFQHLWNTHSDTMCPVSGGRGATAAADYAAHKRITMPDVRGRARFGRDNMGGTAAGKITLAIAGADPTIVGTVGGFQNCTLLRSDLPNVTLTYSGSSSVTGTFSGTTSSAARSNSQSNNIDFSHSGGEHSASDLNYGTGTCSGSITGSGTSSGTTSSLNGGVTQTTFSRMNPFYITNVFMAF